MKASISKTATKAERKTTKTAATLAATAVTTKSPRARTAAKAVRTSQETQVQSAAGKKAGKTSTPQPARSASASTGSVNKSRANPAKSTAPTPAPRPASSKAGPGKDRIEQPAVSKVSEVATKTTKSTPAAPGNGGLLTEEQILQMSEKDYMNEAQLAFFRARLQQLERDLLKNADETTEHLRETVLVPDPADRATIEEEHALELRTRDRERKLLKKVQQALASIESGDYGWCEETGEPIGIPRLLARPTATLSLEAQQRRELKQKLYGD
ncbi:MAG TPA: RNA polymerase-binding protein DksA [Noviherbaspirillum sp.]